TPAFTPDVDGDYVIQLIVSDGLTDSDVNVVTITSSTETSLNLRTFDFSDNSQLSDLPSFGTDPSFIQGGKLVCPIQEGEHKGLGRKYRFDSSGGKVDEVEMSFTLNVDANFQKDTAQNEVGKFPGFEGIYDETAGWGGKQVTTQNSWSVRIGNGLQNSDNEVPIGLYVYHPGMSGQFGTTVDVGYALTAKQDYTITLYLKLNDVGQGNGIITLSIDGVVVYSSNTWTLRLDDSVHVRSVWLDAYIGGVTPSTHSTSVLLDDLSIQWWFLD
ncbi:MAG: hypothetical protein KUG73_07615, partial [Pseudomonadales bacterium]|nr:hypothetical protein [Pseudomonadales bacterium]